MHSVFRDTCSLYFLILADSVTITHLPSAFKTYPAVAVSVPISLFIWVCGLKKNSLSAVPKRFVEIAEINTVFNLPPFAFKKMI